MSSTEVSVIVICFAAVLCLAAGYAASRAVRAITGEIQDNTRAVRAMVQTVTGMNGRVTDLEIWRASVEGPPRERANGYRP